MSPRPPLPLERGVAVRRAVEAYGSAPGQVGEWWLPLSDRRPALVVLVHGGFWKPGYDRSLEDAVAVALVEAGHAVWNVDYRAADAGWPATLADAAAALDSVAASPHAAGLDPARVAVVGHSAGGHLALWLGSRHRLPAGAVGAGPLVRPALVVGQAPVADLGGAWSAGLGGGAVAALVGGGPGELPERYAVADPLALLAPGVTRAVLLHGEDDRVVPPGQSRAYLVAATAAGAPVALRLLPGTGHDEHLDPGSAAVGALLAELATL